MSRLDVLFAKFVSKTLLPCVMEEGTNIHLVATGSITLNALVLVWVVETLDCGVTLTAL